MSTATALILDNKDYQVVTIENKEVSVVFQKDGLQPAIDMIKEVVTSFKPDLTTDKGRKEIASMARKVSSAKVAIDNLGKEYGEELKTKLSVITTERSRMCKVLDELRDETRKPLTEWEEAEEKRTANHQSKLNEINGFTVLPAEPTVEELQKRLDSVSVYRGFDYEEFSELAKTSLNSSETFLRDKIASIQKIEEERAELKRLKDAEAERLKTEQARLEKEREEKLKSEAAEQARKDAEAKAANDAKEAEAKAQAEIEKANRDKLEAEQKAAKAEADAKAAAEKAESDRVAAEAKAKAEQEEAVLAERDRLEREAKAKADEDAKREADKKHCGKVNTQATHCLISIGLTEEMAKKVITAIAKNEIANVKIIY